MGGTGVHVGRMGRREGNCCNEEVSPALDINLIAFRSRLNCYDHKFPRFIFSLTKGRFNLEQLYVRKH